MILRGREPTFGERRDYHNGMSDLPTLNADDFEDDPAALADLLATGGACFVAGWPRPDLHAALRDDLLRLQAQGELARAAVGRSDGRALREDIRNDSTCWLDDPRCGPAAGVFLSRMDALRGALNRTLYLGLQRFEAHYASYPPGGGYARHRDRFRDSDARVVTWVTYLNDDWRDADGGALRLWRTADDWRDLPPVGGSLCFLSEREHQVLPTRRERHSIAGWFRRDLA